MVSMPAPVPAQTAPTKRIAARSDGRRITEPLLAWYSATARVLPWRASDVAPWAVLVSEVMLQQTPVARVLPAWQAWLARWPGPAELAAAPTADVLRMWGKLGYPRRALRLQACASEVCARFGGTLPSAVDDLESLPGVGAYTARAVAAFAFRARVPVVDTNVRRVVARAVLGQGAAGSTSTTRDHALVESLLPGSDAPRFSVALMELGALVCVARTPRCGACPIVDRCAWVATGSPPWTGPRPRPQRFAGTDRQVRGLLLDELRAATGAVDAARLDLVWPDPVQRARALDGLMADGLVERLPDGRFALPGG